MHFYYNKRQVMWAKRKQKRVSNVIVVLFSWTWFRKNAWPGFTLHWTWRAPAARLKEMVSVFSLGRQDKLTAFECFWHDPIFYSNIIDHDCASLAFQLNPWNPTKCLLTCANHYPVIFIHLFLVLKNSPHKEHFPCSVQHKGGVH